MSANILIFGFGYTARFLAKRLNGLGFHITGTLRNQTSRHQINHEGYDLIDFENIDDVEKKLRSATHILISTPPSKQSGDPVLHHLIDLIKKYAPGVQWLGYLSSTGVYGDHQGRWVDESSVPTSLGSQANIRLDAEKSWIALAKEYKLPLHVFRLAGIYGPQRNALTRIAQGKTQTIYKENHVFSRIHVDDIVAVVLASIKNPNPMSIYNVADDEPAPSHEIDQYASHLLNVTAPEKIPFEQADLSPMAKEFYTHHRRVSNAKLKQELIAELIYPTYREGLQELYNTRDDFC